MVKTFHCQNKTKYVSHIRKKSWHCCRKLLSPLKNKNIKHLSGVPIYLFIDNLSVNDEENLKDESKTLVSEIFGLKKDD